MVNDFEKKLEYAKEAFKHGKLTIDFGEKRVFIGDSEIMLTKKEYDEIKQYKDYIPELKKAFDKIRKETVREIIEFAENFFTWDEEGFVRELKECFGVEVEE